MTDATIPTEAFDPTHSDHEWWVEQTGRCLAGDDCPVHRRHLTTEASS